MACKHGMPSHLGCNDCIIEKLSDDLRQAELERGRAIRALNFVLRTFVGLDEAIAACLKVGEDYYRFDDVTAVACADALRRLKNAP